MSKLHILFDGPPGPEAGRFVEVENDDGKSIRVGEWKEREDGFWELVISPKEAAPDLLEACKRGRNALAVAIKACGRGMFADEDVSTHTVIMILDAAIAKAEGSHE